MKIPIVWLWHCTIGENQNYFKGNNQEVRYET